MSLLISNVKMPRNGEMIDIVITSDGVVRAYDNENEKIGKAVELPKHGPLIDQDRVVRWLSVWSKTLIKRYGENDEYVKCLSDVLEGLGCAEVIIPAERGKE